MTCFSYFLLKDILNLFLKMLHKNYFILKIGFGRITFFGVLYLANTHLDL